MARKAKKTPAPYSMERYGILNHFGDVWTPDTFGSVEEALRHIDNYQRRYSGDLSKHTVVRVRVTVEVVPGSI